MRHIEYDIVISFFYISIIANDLLLCHVVKRKEKEMGSIISIKEVLEKYIEGCQGKVKMSTGRMFGKAVLAGAMIALGAAGSSVAAHTVPDVGLARLAASVVFPMGLMMVMLLGAELFTGDCLVAMSGFDRKQKLTSIIRVLVLVYGGNFVGATLLAWFVSMSGQWNYSGGMLGAYTIKVAMGKVGITFTQGIVSGILCNILVCGAVLMAMCAKDAAGKLLAIFFMIMLFVTSGFEHCVANMYYITAGMLAMNQPEYVELAMTAYGYTAQQLSQLNGLNYVLTNLVPVTIGNILGGVIFTGAPLYYLNMNKGGSSKEVMNKEEKKNVMSYSGIPADPAS